MPTVHCMDVLHATILACTIIEPPTVWTEVIYTLPCPIKWLVKFPYLLGCTPLFWFTKCIASFVVNFCAPFSYLPAIQLCGIVSSTIILLCSDRVRMQKIYCISKSMVSVLDTGAWSAGPSLITERCGLTLNTVGNYLGMLRLYFYHWIVSCELSIIINI